MDSRTRKTLHDINYLKIGIDILEKNMELLFVN